MSYYKQDKLIIIAPTAPPAVCGVSDYAWQVAVALTGKKYGSVELGVQNWQPAMRNGMISVSPWKTAINEAISKKTPTDILFNYTPRSFSKIALPLKLLWSFKKFLKANKLNRLFVIFHETWSEGPNPKIHHLIMSAFSKWVSYRLGNLASGLLALTEEQGRKLNKVLPLIPVRIGFVGANISPYPFDAGLHTKRKEGIWVVFGLSHTRLWTLKKYSALIQHLIQTGKMKQLRIIGPVDDAYGLRETMYIKESLFERRLIQLGTLKQEEVSCELLSASGGLVGQSADSLKKSGSFAAMAAHAVPVVCDVAEALKEPSGRFLFRPQELFDDFRIFENECVDRSRKLHEWYWTTRSWDAIGKDLLSWMKN